MSTLKLHKLGLRLQNYYGRYSENYGENFMLYSKISWNFTSLTGLQQRKSLIIAFRIRNTKPVWKFQWSFRNIVLCKQICLQQTSERVSADWRVTDEIRETVPDCWASDCESPTTIGVKPMTRYCNTTVYLFIYGQSATLSRTPISLFTFCTMNNFPHFVCVVSLLCGRRYWYSTLCNSRRCHMVTMFCQTGVRLSAGWWPSLRSQWFQLLPSISSLSSVHSRHTHSCTSSR